METYLKQLDADLTTAIAHLKEELRSLRSSRPSIEFIEELRADYFGVPTPIKQLGSLSLMPPREIRIMVWDKSAIGAVTKAIEDAQAGFAVSADGTTIRAVLAALSNERREELSKTVKKTTEQFRIEVRGIRDDVMKKVRGAEDRDELTEDQVRSGKEKIEKRVKEANDAIERLLEEKLRELAE